jgi:hypothetical protein
MENVFADFVGKPKSVSKSESSVKQPTPDLQNLRYALLGAELDMLLGVYSTICK